MERPAIEIEQGESAAVVALRGEHDLSTAEELRRHLGPLGESQTTIVVDLTETIFIDSSVLGVLIAENERAGRSGGRFAVVLGEGASHGVRRVFDLAGVSSVLNVVGSREEAVRPPAAT
jgi:HptB-dependent secretion and biofilm anti anti-sigma factor